MLPFRFGPNLGECGIEAGLRETVRSCLGSAFCTACSMGLESLAPLAGCSFKGEAQGGVSTQDQP